MKQILLILFFSALMFGCGLSPVSTPEIQTYTLLTVPNNIPLSLQQKQTILISAMVAAPGYSHPNMIYMDKPFELSSFAKHEWVSPPAEMVTPLLIETLRKTGRFHAVVSPPFTGDTEFRLDTQLVTLRQEFLSKPSIVRIAIQAELIDDASNKVIASHLFQTVTPTSKNTPYGGVIAANQGLQTLLGQLADFVVQASRVK